MTYRRRRRAACAIEYCLVVSLVAVVLIAGSQHFGASIVNTFGELTGFLASGAGDPEPDSGEQGDGNGQPGSEEQPGGGQPGGDQQPDGKKPGGKKPGRGRGRH